MSVDVSTLAIKVESSGIKEASDALGSKGLTRSAENADKAVASLTGNLGALFRAGGNITGVFSGLTGTMALINNAMQTAADNATAMARSLAFITNSLGDLTAATNESSRAIQRHNGHGGVFVTTLKAMASAAVAYMSIGAARHLVEQSDSWTMMTAKLKIVTGSTQDAKDAQQDLFDIAQRIRVPLDDMGKLYARMVPPLQTIGKSSEDASKMIEAVSLALKLNGSTAAESASVMLQFSQALQKGKLDGQEFNAVASNGPLIMRAIAEATGKTQAELAQLRSKGFITVDVLVKALEDALPKWQKMMADMPLTVEDAWTRVKNIWFKSVGEIGGDNDLGKSLAASVQKLEQYIPQVVSVLVESIMFIADNIKGVAALISGLIAMGMTKWVLETVEAFGKWTKVIEGTNTAMKVLDATLKFLGGPLSIFIGLLTAAGVAAYLWWGKSDEASTGVTKKTEVDVQKRIAFLDKEITKLQERNKEAANGTVKVAAQDGTSDAMRQEIADIIKLQDAIKDAHSRGTRASEATAAALQKTLDAKQAEMSILALKEAGYKAEQKKTAETARNLAILEETQKWQLKVGTTAQKIAIEKKQANDEWMAKTGQEAPAWVMHGIEQRNTHTDKKASTTMEDQVKAAQNAAAAVKKLGDEADLEAKKIEGSTNSTVKLSAAEIELFNLQKLRDSITSNKKAQSPEALKLINEAMAADQAVIAKERNNATTLEAKKAAEANTKAQEAQIDAAQKELDTVNAKIASYGQLKGTADDAALSEAKLAMAQFGDQAPDEWVKRQLHIIDVLQEVHDKKLQLAATDNSVAIDKWFDESKAADFGNGFADAFGAAGKAIDKAGKSLDQYKKKMAANAEQAAKIKKEAEDPKGDALKAAHDAELLRKKELNDTLDYYADMAGAVKGFFKEKTAAYKVFDTLEKGLRIARMAQDAEEIAVKITQGWAWITAKVAQAWTAMTVDNTTAGNSVKNSTMAGEASLSAGIAKCFEQMGVWGFVGAGAIIAFMAAWGFGGHGGGGSAPNLKEERQKANGTGTVLGDEAAKSESLSKSLDLLVGKYNMGLEYSSRMLGFLRSINDGIAGLAASAAAISGVRGTTADQFAAGVGSSKGALGFSSSSTDMTDSGLQFDPNQTLSSIMSNGANVQSYYDLHKQSSSWWGLSKKSSDQHVTSAVGDDFKQQVSATVSDMVALTNEAAKSLGVADDTLTQKLGSMKLGIDQISLNGLSGDDLDKAINAAFSKLGDQMASAVAGGIGGSAVLSQFQRVGEGSLETLVRLGSGLENAKMLLDNLGISVAKFSDIADKHGDVDTELVRTSIHIKEAGSNVGKMIDDMTGSADDLVTAYKTLIDVRGKLKFSGLANDVSQAMVSGAGGLDNLSSAMSDFTSKFYTDSQQTAMSMSKLNDEFGALGLAMPTSKEDFKAVVTELMGLGDEGQKTAAQMLGLSGAFADAMDAMASSVADKKSALKDAYDNESGAIQDNIDKMKDFVSSLKDFKNTLIQGDLSTLNAVDKYAAAKSAYDTTYSKAMGGDADAISKFQDVANTLLTTSRAVNASGDAYTKDFQTVLNATDAIMGQAQGKQDVAQQQLDAMKSQVGALIDLTDSTKTVAQALNDLTVALGGTPTQTASAAVGGVSTSITEAPATADAPAAAADSAAQQSNAALLTEIQSLRAEVQGLRAEQAKQTDAMIGAEYDAAEKAADKVVSGYGNSQYQSINYSGSIAGAIQAAVHALA